MPLLLAFGTGVVVGGGALFAATESKTLKYAKWAALAGGAWWLYTKVKR